MQVDDNQVVLPFDKLQQVNMAVHGVALHVEFIDVLYGFDGGYLPNEIVFGDQSFDPMHVLEVLKALELITGDIDRGHISQILANVLWHRLDLIMRQVEDLDPLRQHPKLLNFVIAQVQIL